MRISVGNKKAYIILILILAGAVRLWNLAHVPPSPSLDEVSIGYNAYSILRTGRDEYGTLLPLVLRAYDDFRPALYVYTVVPFELFLGVSPLAVRLPSAIFGVLSVLLTYFLVLELFSHESRITNLPAGRQVTQNENYSLALLSALFLAISPWHIYLSRLGHEVNLGFTVTIGALYCFFRWANNPNRSSFLYVSAVLFAVSLGTYQSQKIIIPISALLLAYLYRDTLLRYIRSVGIAAIIGLAVSMPFVSVSLHPEALVRYRATSAFQPTEPLYADAREHYILAQQTGNVVGMIVSNRRIVSLRIFLNNYASHLQQAWLFSGSARENHKVPFMGLLFWWQAPLILIGLWALRLDKYRTPFLFLLLLGVVSILPGAVTTQAPHAMRTYPFVLPLQVLSSAGLVFLFRAFRGKRMRILGTCIVCIVVTTGFLQLIREYFVTFPKTQSDSFQYALSEALRYVKIHEDDYQSIVVSNEDDLYQSYMFYLFGSTVDPNVYQGYGGTVSGGFAETHRIGKYVFRPIRWQTEDQTGDTLYVGNMSDFPPSVITVSVMKNLDGTDAIRIVGG